MNLFRQQFRAQWVGLLIWTVCALLLTVTTTRSAPAAVQSGMLEIVSMLPPQLQKAIGVPAGLSPLDAFIAVKLAASTALVLALYAVVLALSTITREVDRRTIDFLLSLPVDRGQVILARAAVMLVNLGVLSVATWFIAIADLKAQGLEGSWNSYLLLMVNQWLFAAAVGAIALLGSLFIDDYALGIKLFLGITATAFFLEMGLRAADISRLGRAWSPFSYVDAGEVLRAGALPLGDTLALAGATALALALCVPVFRQKQIAA